MRKSINFLYHIEKNELSEFLERYEEMKEFYKSLNFSENSSIILHFRDILNNENFLEINIDYIIENEIIHIMNYDEIMNFQKNYHESYSIYDSIINSILESLLERIEYQFFNFKDSKKNLLKRDELKNKFELSNNFQSNQFKIIIEKYLENYDISYDDYLELLLDISIFIMRNDYQNIFKIQEDEKEELYNYLISKYNFYELYDIIYDFEFSELLIHYFMNRINQEDLEYLNY